MTSLRSARNPPKRTRFSTSCVEKRFSPVARGGSYASAISASREKSSGSHGSSNQRSRNGASALAYGEGFLAAELGVGIDRELRMRGQDRLDGFYSAHVLGEREASDL